MNYNGLDFADIKENIKKYLQKQDKFKDYDFDGAGLSILLDILAYNTTYNGFYLNMLSSEMFLDSAYLRENVVSRAKHLNYTPRSDISAKAIVDISMSAESETASIKVLPYTAAFYSSYDSKTFYFYPIEDVNLVKEGNFYVAKNIELIEGRRFKHSWTVNTSLNLKQRFILPNKKVDISQLKVLVKESSSSTVKNYFRINEDINVIDGNSRVYFLQETDGGLYEIYFGDGILGKKLENGNIIEVEYLVSSGEKVKGARTFTLSGALIHNSITNVTTVERASGYYERESIESVKYLAPRSYEMQNRAVTKSDYETILKKDIPNIEYLRVWGGEDNSPPMFGRVYIALKPFGATILSTADKQDILRTYIKPRSPISIESIIVDPEYLFLKIHTSVTYKSINTVLTEVNVGQKVLDSIYSYRNDELNGFDSDFVHSRLTQYINNSDNSVRGNLTDIELKYRLYPTYNIATRYEIYLENALIENTVNSSAFMYKNLPTFIGDSGKGSLYLYRLVSGVRVIIEDNIGVVNYITGKIVIDKIIMQEPLDNMDSFLDIFVTPRKKDINASRNQIIIIDDNDIDITIQDLDKE